MPNAKGIPLTGLENARTETKRIYENVERIIHEKPIKFEEKDYREVDLPAKIDPDWGC